MAEQLVVLPVAHIDELAGNVNVMAGAEYDTLCQDIAAGHPVPPIVVVQRPDGRYTVVDGNHRLRACRAVGRKELPAIVIDLADEEQQEIYAAKLNIVRGQIDRLKMTKLWHKVRASREQAEAMRALGISSEERLSRLVALATRKVDAGVVVNTAVQEMMSRVATVEDLIPVIRAALGDAGTGEYDYLVFQVHGAQILLFRCSKGEMEQLEGIVARIRESGVSPVAYLIGALAHGPPVQAQVELTEG